MVVYLGKQLVIRANKSLTAMYGQSHVVQQEANLDYALDRVEHYGEGIKNEDEKVLKKAAFLLYHLAYTSHAFWDGNKRTALLSMASFLVANGYTFIPGDERQVEVARTMKEIASGKHTINFICRWLKTIAKKKQPSV